MDNIREKELIDHMAKNLTSRKSAREKKNLCVGEKRVYAAIKRIFDLICSLLGLVVLSPVFLISASTRRKKRKAVLYL